MENNDNLINIEFNRLLSIIKTKKLYIVFIILLFVCFGYIYSFYYKVPLYESSSTIILANSNSSALSESVTQSDLTLNQKLVTTYSNIIKSKSVLEQTIDNLNLDINTSDLSKQITVSAISNTEIIKLSVQNSDPVQANNIANELVNVFSKEVKRIYNIDNVNIIDKSKIAEEACNINHLKDLILFTAMGLFFALVFVFIIYFFDTSIKDEKDIEEYINLDVLTKIPVCNFHTKKEKKNNSEIITHQDRLSPVSECFRNLKMNITLKKNDSPIKTILVTSVSSGEGKSWVSTNLANIFAQANKNVLIIDSDMRKGRQNKLFELPNDKGLSNCLSSNIENDKFTINDIAPFIKGTKIFGIHLLTSGTLPVNPSELLSSNRMKCLLEEVSKIYDIVIIDGCPCKIVSDSIGLSNIVDTSLLVVESKKTKIDDVKNVKKQIISLGGKISGIVLNKISISAKLYKNNYYYGEKSKIKLISETSEEDLCFRTVQDLIKKANISSINAEIFPIKSSTSEINSNVNVELNNNVTELISKLYNQLNKTQEIIQDNKNEYMQKLEDSHKNIISELTDKLNDITYKEDFENVNNHIEDINQKLNDITYKEDFENIKFSLKELQTKTSRIENDSNYYEQLIELSKSILLIHMEQKDFIAKQLDDVNQIKSEMTKIQKSIEQQESKNDLFEKEEKKKVVYLNNWKNNNNVYEEKAINQKNTGIFNNIFNKKSENLVKESFLNNTDFVREYSIDESIQYEDLAKDPLYTYQILNNSMM